MKHFLLTETYLGFSNIRCFPWQVEFVTFIADVPFVQIIRTRNSPASPLRVRVAPLPRFSVTLHPLYPQTSFCNKFRRRL
jgi:hypothetical protein